MNSRFRSVLWLLLAAPAFTPLFAAAPFDFKFEPAWIESEDTDRQSLAARFELGTNRSFFRGKFDGSFATALKGTVMRRSADNPENLTAAAEGIATWLWEQDLAAPPPASGATASATSQ